MQQKIFAQHTSYKQKILSEKISKQFTTSYLSILRRHKKYIYVLNYYLFSISNYVKTTWEVAQTVIAKITNSNQSDFSLV